MARLFGLSKDALIPELFNCPQHVCRPKESSLVEIKLQDFMLLSLQLLVLKASMLLINLHLCIAFEQYLLQRRTLLAP